jgi:hypothetical protein
MRRRNVKAWLITWEGDHNLANNVAMLLHPKTAERRVAELIDLLYANACGTPSERLLYLTERDFIGRPYRLRLADRDGCPRDRHILCGENPCLYARLVEHVRVERSESGTEALQWSEIDG